MFTAWIFSLFERLFDFLAMIGPWIWVGSALGAFVIVIFLHLKRREEENGRS